MGERELDFSATTAPASWHQAASEAPGAGGGTRPGPGPGRRGAATLPRLPNGRTIDPMLTFLAGTTVSIAGGYLWYALYRGAGVTAPWPALAVGLVIALGVRLGAGPHEPSTRAAVAGLLYIVTLAVVTYLTTRWTYRELYGRSPGLVSFEQQLVRGRLTDPAWLGASTGGLVVALRASLLFGRRRR